MLKTHPVSTAKQAESNFAALDDLLAQVNDAVIAVDHDQHLIYLNAAAERQYGVTASEFLGHRLNEIYVCRWLRPEDEAAIQTALRERGQWRGENIHITRDGRELYVESNVSVLRGPHGENIGIFAVIRDITSHKQMELTNARLAAIVAASDDAIVGKDLRGIVTSWNTGAEKMFGYQASEMIGQSIERIIPPEQHREEEIEILERIRRGETVEHFETVRLHKDGRILNVSLTVSPIKDPTGKIFAAAKVAKNITKRKWKEEEERYKRAEEALHMSEQEFRSLAEAMPQIVWATRPDGWNTYFNQRWVDYTGMTLEESYGHGWNKPFHPDDKLRAWEAWQRATQHNERYSMECRLRRADGVYRWWLIRGEPLRGSRGEVLKWIGTCTDIEDIKNAEAALKDANDLLEQRVAERMAAQEESETRFRTMANAMPQLAWIARPDGHIFWYNERWYQYTGTTPEQMEGWGWQSVHDPALLPSVLEQWKASLASGAPFEMTFPLRGADGVFRPFLTRGFPLKNAAGRVMQWFGTNTDISELKQVMESLAAQQRLYKSVTDNATVALFIVDEKQQCSFMNPAAEHLTGYTLEETRGRPLHDVVHHTRPDGSPYPLSECPIDQAFHKKNKMQGEEVFVHKDGHFYAVTFTASPLPDERGMPVGTIIEVQDITGRKQAEEALRVSEERWRYALEMSEMGAWELDLTNKKAWRSLRHDQIFGYETLLPEWTYEMFLKHVLESDREDVDRTFQRSVAEKQSWNFECRIRRADGAERWIWAYGKTLNAGNGRTQRMFGLVADITERKKLIIRLADEDRRKNEFMAILAHELRNPLTPIKAASQALRMAKINHPTVVRAQEIIERQSNHMTRLVDDLLDIARLQSGKVRLKFETVNLAQAVSDAIESCDHIIKLHNHQIKLNMQKLEPLWVEGDPARIVQIVGNIVSNAAKYTPDCGLIQVTAGVEDGMAVIRVQDNGIGIAPEMLSRIFQAYTQIEQTLDRSQGGLGLGLKLVQELVLLHRGSVEVHSEGLNKGSEFVVRLPLTRVPVCSADNEKVRGVEPSVHRKILLIDDNVDILESMQMMLTLCGHSVVLAETGTQGIEKALQGVFDVALVDIGLPDMNGYEVAKKIRQSAACAALVLIALSGYSQENDRRLSREAGFDAHLAKPADANVLTDLLKDLEKVKRTALRS